MKERIKNGRKTEDGRRLIIGLLTAVVLMTTSAEAVNKKWARNLAFNTAAHAVFVGYDVASYPTWGNQNIIIYRGTQYVLQGAIVYTLWQETGWLSAVAWLIEWWFFNDDLLYYPLYDAVYDRTATRDELFGDRITWAWWTLPEIITNGGKRRIVPGVVLLERGLLGKVIGITFNVAF